MLRPTLRIGSELLPAEKADIFARMSAVAPEERDTLRKSLVDQYGISKGSITSLIANETMRKQRTEGSPKVINLQSQTQTRTYDIISLNQITEDIRQEIISEFSSAIQNSVGASSYDFYQDIETISKVNSIDPAVLEQFLMNRFTWLGERLEGLKKGKALTEEDKMNIRIYVAEGVDKKEKKKRRKEMEQKYGVNIKVIGPITAWKIGENGEKILKKDDAHNTTRVDTLGMKEGTQEPFEANMGTQEFPQVTESQTERPSEGESTLTDEDRAFILELAGSFDLNDDLKRALFLQDVFDCFPYATIEDVKKVIPNLTDDQSHTNAKRSGEGMGALVNYNNVLKNKWREKLEQFIDENTDKEKRATMKVLCLPGVECLEIPLYIKLGFRPENIVGVEAGIVKGKKDLEVIARFQANATRCRIQTRIGKLEDVLKTEETVFDVVSLDFLGPISKQALEIVHLIKGSKRHILLTNFQAKRENLLKNQLIGMAGFQKDGRYVLMGEDRYEGVYGAIDKISSKSNAKLDDYRKSSIVAQILRSHRLFSQQKSAGKIADRLNAIFNIQNINQISELTSNIGIIPTRHGLALMLVDMISRIFDNIFDTYKNYLPGRNIDILKTQIHIFIRDILLENNIHVPIHRMYSYSATGTTMISDYLVFDKSLPEDIYMFRDLYNIILDLAEILIKDFIVSKGAGNYTNLTYHIIDKNFILKEGPGNSTDQLVIAKDKFSKVALPFGRLLKLLGMFVKYKKNRNQYAIERTPIE